MEGSVLSAMFSGRWEQSLDHDSQGRIFLDFDPYCFEQILTFLRCRSSDTTKRVNTPAPIITADKQHAFASLVDFLGLTELLGSPSHAKLPYTGAAECEDADEHTHQKTSKHSGRDEQLKMMFPRMFHESARRNVRA